MMLVTEGSTDVTTYFHLRLAADGTDATGLTITGIDLQYVRSGVAPSTKADATALAAVDSAHGDNQAIEVDATDQPGVYRVDWPDAAFASGVSEVILTVKVATAFTESLRVRLMSATRGLAGTALPAAAADAAGGLPISDAGGLNMDNMAGLIDEGTAQSADGTGVVLRAGAAFADDTLIGATIQVFGSTQGYWQSRTITDNALTGDAVTVPTWTVTPSGTITYRIYGSALGATIAEIQNGLATQTSVDDLPTNAELATALGTADDAVLAAIAALNDLTADNIWDEAIGDGTITARQAMRVLISALAGKVSGAATTTMTFRNDADSADVIVATVDADGNRSAVTLTP